MAMEQKNEPASQLSWKRLSTPSARWSVLALVIVGLLIGAGGVIGDAGDGGGDRNQQVLRRRLPFDAVGGERIPAERALRQPDRRAAPGCHDCHIPHRYPALLCYKAKAGIKDVIGEMRGVISTEEKFKKERARMAKEVWAEFKANNSANCRTCHQFNKDIVAKQKDFVRPMHEQSSPER